MAFSGIPAYLCSSIFTEIHTLQNTILINFVLITSCRWFAKRFLHPDVVSIYDYIFLWDEDLGVENFHPGRYH